MDSKCLVANQTRAIEASRIYFDIYGYISVSHSRHRFLTIQIPRPTSCIEGATAPLNNACFPRLLKETMWPDVHFYFSDTTVMLLYYFATFTYTCSPQACVFSTKYIHLHYTDPRIRISAILPFHISLLQAKNYEKKEYRVPTRFIRDFPNQTGDLPFFQSD